MTLVLSGCTAALSWDRVADVMEGLECANGKKEFEPWGRASRRLLGLALLEALFVRSRREAENGLVLVFSKALSLCIGRGGKRLLVSLTSYQEE